MKFPKTRRDKAPSPDNIVSTTNQTQSQDNVDGGYLCRPDESKELSPEEAHGYPSPYARRQKAFHKESVQPLGANVDSWSNLLDSRAASRAGPDASRERTNNEDLDDDDVFFNDDDMRRMRLGISDTPGPSAYTTMAMMAAHPEESHFGQGLEYFGPGFHVGASGLEVFFCVWNILTYLLDIGSDIYLAYLYFSGGHYAWFGLTLGFVAVPAIAMSIFSLVLYIRDWKMTGVRGTACHWTSRAVFMVLQLAPLLRIFETMIYGCRSRDPDKDILKRRKLYDRMVNEDTDSLLIRLFEAFMEAAPQLVLQLYIITQIGTDKGVFLVVVQCFGLVTSALSLATILVSYQRSLRLSQMNKTNLRFPGMIVMFLWRLFTIVARVLALALFASYFTYWVFVVVGVHWLAMLIWVIKQHTLYCMFETEDGKQKHNRCEELCFRILAAFVQIFCFFNLLEGHTRLRCVLYYTLVYVENAVMILGWYIGASSKTETGWYHMPALLIVLLGFWFGILFQLIYYKCYHPNNYSVLHSRRRIQWCIDCQYLSLTKEVQYEVEPTASEVIKSQLSLNLNMTMQSVQSAHNAQYQPPERGHFTPAPVFPELEPGQRTPRRMFPQQSGSLSSRSTLTSQQPGSTKPRIVQKKWQPPERLPAGSQKLNNTFDSDSTCTTSTVATGASQPRSSSAQTRAMKRAKRAQERAKAQEQAHPDNQEPLPCHTSSPLSQVPEEAHQPSRGQPPTYRQPGYNQRYEETQPLAPSELPIYHPPHVPRTASQWPEHQDIGPLNHMDNSLEEPLPETMTYKVSAI